MKKSDVIFVLMEVSKLSLDDEFMRYGPKTEEEKNFYESLFQVINKGLKDFYRPTIDPSFTKPDQWSIDYDIQFLAGREPALGRSYKWWKRAAKSFMPERGSRLGTKSEYIAFLGLIIKELVDIGWTKEKAWNAVCCDSSELGNYWDCENPKCGFDPTGSREILGLYDLGNTYKFLSDDDMNGAFNVTGFWLAGGCFSDDGAEAPLADITHYFDRFTDFAFGTGWVVLEK